jgi:hypothetical protein
MKTWVINIHDFLRARMWNCGDVRKRDREVMATQDCDVRTCSYFYTCLLEAPHSRPSEARSHGNLGSSVLY